MTEVNPCGWLQNAGSTHTAEQLRSYIQTTVGGRTGASTSLISRGGINRYLGNQFLVTQTGSPSMGVIVKSGLILVPGTEGSKQGLYYCENDGDVTLTITASHATLNRIDLVVARVKDAFYSGVTNAWDLEITTGTAAASPSPPTAPANSVILAQVAVNAAVTTIVNANITDKRPFLRNHGVLIPCTSSTRPTDVIVGDAIIETDTNLMYWWDSAAWQFWMQGASTWTSYTPTWTSSSGSPAINNGTLTGRWRYLGNKLIVAEVYLVGGSTTAWGTGVFFFSLPINATTDSQHSSRGSGALLDAAVQEYGVITKIEDATKFRLLQNVGNVTNSSPFTFGVNDSIAAQLTYETV